MTEEVKEKMFVVSSSPHLVEPSSSKRVMYEVCIGMIPAIGVALYHFRERALIVLLSCIVSAIATEYIFNAVRKKAKTHFDGSALVTAIILGLSLPATLVWWKCVLGTFVAIGIAKMLFGGLGSNIFNPAMVGRAFLMAAFGSAMTTWVFTADQDKAERALWSQEQISQTVQLCAADGSEESAVEEVAVVSGATLPLTGATLLKEDDSLRKAYKKSKRAHDTAIAEARAVLHDAEESGIVGEELAVAQEVYRVAEHAAEDAYDATKKELKKERDSKSYKDTISTLMGSERGSAGETSAIAWLIGGLFLLVRRTITWRIPLGVLLSSGVIALIAWWVNPIANMNPIAHWGAGGLMMCAFFIATDPVTCPLSRKGRFIFGLGVGALIMIIRLFGALPEGVMYAVLIMNMLTPLLDRCTRPMPLGGHVKNA
ncbi:MAG: RnfABCDGE type electron transport complex subunit D [Phycisphaerae bacterium]|nr:RnfABCDGE type electron transport complex subunit D [Phycisphaerae bacterium]